MSDEAKRSYINQRLAPEPKYPSDLSGIKAELDRNHYEPLLERALAAYSVQIRHSRIGGVDVDVVTPKSGARNRRRVLICLRCSMEFGAGKGGLLEAIPIAATARIKVISVDYRELPDFHFPAASEDVASVFKALLMQYHPENIGIYGCSAGGALTASAVAWFQRQKLPRPGAIGIFCSGADNQIAGDSSFTTVPLIQDPGARLLPPPPKPNPPALFAGDDYTKGNNRTDALIAPAFHPDVLAKFPPTLLITGTRDVALSTAANTQRLLVNAGVDAELHVWDGMWHSFFVDVSLPESREVFTVVARFFEAHLGQSRPAHRARRNHDQL